MLEVSIGDYVLAGGEAAVLVIVEAVARLLPGVLGNAESAVDDSFASGAGRACWRGRSTPSRPSGAAAPSPTCCCPGTTRRSTAWRREQAVERTRRVRPELLG